MKKILLLYCGILTCCTDSTSNRKLKSKEEVQIVGRWKVVASSLIPFEHISFCRKLDIGSIFEFQKNKVVNVYENEKTDKNCNQRQSFWIDSLGLAIHEYDINFYYKILKLTNDSLVLETKNVPSYYYSFDFPILDSNAIRNIETNGIQIRMIKISNGS